MTPLMPPPPCSSAKDGSCPLNLLQIYLLKFSPVFWGFANMEILFWGRNYLPTNGGSRPSFPLGFLSYLNSRGGRPKSSSAAGPFSFGAAFGRAGLRQAGTSPALWLSAVSTGSRHSLSSASLKSPTAVPFFSRRPLVWISSFVAALILVASRTAGSWRIRVLLGLFFLLHFSCIVWLRILRNKFDLCLHSGRTHLIF